MQTVNILGTEYKIEKLTKEEDKKLEDCDGYCDKTVKKIVIIKDAESDLTDIDWYYRKILRHEITHAFFMESGMQENFECKPWGIMETLVDWIAIQFPKMQKAFEEAGAL